MTKDNLTLLTFTAWFGCIGILFAVIVGSIFVGIDKIVPMVDSKDTDVHSYDCSIPAENPSPRMVLFYHNPVKQTLEGGFAYRKQVTSFRNLARSMFGLETAYRYEYPNFIISRADIAAPPSSIIGFYSGYRTYDCWKRGWFDE